MEKVWVVVETYGGLVEGEVKAYESERLAEKEALRILEDRCSCGRCLKRWKDDYGDLTCGNSAVGIFECSIHKEADYEGK